MNIRTIKDNVHSDKPMEKIPVLTTKKSFMILKMNNCMLPDEIIRKESF